MKTKTFTPTRAKLPANEMVIGGDASPKLYNTRREKRIDKAFSKLEKNGKKSKNS